MMMPYRMARPIVIAINLLMALLLVNGSSYGKHKKAEEPPFQYLAGTENIEKGCGENWRYSKKGLNLGAREEPLTCPTPPSP